MRAFPVYPDPGIAHDADGLAALDRIARVHPDGTQVSVQAVVTGAVPAMFDHGVFPVIRVAGHEIGLYHFSIGNGADFVEWLTVCIAMHGANIDSFVKSCINEPTRGVSGIAHKAVFAALPRGRFLSLVITFDVLVKSRTITREQSVVVRR